MNKNIRIITINGFMGILIVSFLLFGLVSGFIVSPAWVCMKLWNGFVANYTSLPVINLYQSLLMWGVIALSIYAVNAKRPLIRFGRVYKSLTKEQINSIIKKSQMYNTDIFEEFEEQQNK